MDLPTSVALMCSCCCENNPMAFPEQGTPFLRNFQSFAYSADIRFTGVPGLLLSVSCQSLAALLSAVMSCCSDPSVSFLPRPVFSFFASEVSFTLQPSLHVCLVVLTHCSCDSTFRSLFPFLPVSLWVNWSSQRWPFSPW